jgi:peptide/nickel transport system substrate-binding protein
MKRMKFWNAVFTFTAFFTIALSSLVFAGKSGTVKVGLRYDPSTVNMLEMRLAADIPVVLHMHQSLMAADPETGERVPFLAESLTVMENGKDIMVKLRRDSVFHTGDPVTATDVKWTYEQCADPSNANMMAGPLDEIEDIEIIDAYNLIFRFYDPYAAWQELMWISICSKKYFDKVGREKFRSHPVGSGAFRFVERRIGESITLEAVEDFPAYDVGFKTLKFLTVPDDVTRLAMLETGELDLVSGVLPHQLRRLKRNKHVKIKTSDRVPSLFGIAALPLTDPIMADPDLGKAIRHAINRQEIVDRIFLGEGYPMYIYASKSELGYDPTLKYDFDPEKSREFLKKSSYKPGQKLILTYTSLTPNAPLVAAVIQKYLKNVGIEVKLQQLEEGVAATYTRNRDKRLGHLRLYGWPGGRDPSTRLLLSVLSTSPYASYTTRPQKEKVDALVMAQARETDALKRKALLKELHAIMTEDAVGAILFGLNMIYATTDRIEYNWTPDEAYMVNLHMIKIVK